MNTPVNPSFPYIKVGCKGVFITRTCFHDESRFVKSIPTDGNIDTEATSQSVVHTIHQTWPASLDTIQRRTILIKRRKWSICKIRTPLFKLLQQMFDGRKSRRLEHEKIKRWPGADVINHLRLCPWFISNLNTEIDQHSRNALWVPEHMSRDVRKTDFCICKHKAADQLCGNRTTAQRLCFRYMDSTIPLLPKSEISSL